MKTTQLERSSANTAVPAQGFDIIVVGSGMGGLATASILAQVGGKRVLVLESNFKLGGFLHAFKRQGFEWEPGVHYIGDMTPGSLTRHCMDLVTGGQVQWNRLGPRFERFVFPEETFAWSSHDGDLIARLIARFPGESRAIRGYFRDVRKVRRWSHRWFYSKQFSEPVASLYGAGRRLAQMTTKDYLDSRFDDPLLKAILAGQWPDYGVPPGRSAFGVHAIVAADFGEGGFFPVGGSSQLIDGAVAAIEEAGGRCLVRHPVEEILIDGGRAYGVSVRTRAGLQQYFAPKIVSNAGVDTTFRRLVGASHAVPERTRLSTVEQGPSTVILFLGLGDDPSTRGFEDCNYWIYDGLDHDVESARGGADPMIAGAYLSFGSLRDPTKTRHTAQIISFSEPAEWARFAEGKWKRRGDDYEVMKERYADALLDFVTTRLPGLRDLVVHRELATPLTVESFTGHPGGQVYGRAATPARLGRKQWAIGTSVKGLYLTGTDVVVPGVNSALMIGVMTAAKLLGPGGSPRVIHTARSVAPASEEALV